MDEAAAKLRMEVDSVPEELDEKSRRIKQLEIEREAIRRENDKAKETELSKQISTLKEEEKDLKAKWQSEKDVINKIQQNKIDIENVKFEAEKAEREATTERLPNFVMVNSKNWKTALLNCRSNYTRCRVIRLW